MQFSLLYLKWTHVWRYELHPPHLINVVTLTCKSHNTENVILQREITKENCTKCISFIKVDQGRFATSKTLYANLVWLWSLTLQMLRLAIWDYVCVLVVDILNTRSEMNVRLHNSSKHFMKLEMWANAQRDGRPAEYRWRPLFSAAKFGWCPLLDYRAVTLPRRETRWNVQECPKLANRSQPLVGRSSPYCRDI